jgi:hypothetical protein
VGAWYFYAQSGAYVVPTQAGQFLGMLHYDRLAYYVQFQFLSRFPELAATYGGLILMIPGARELLIKRKRGFFVVWWLSVCADIVASGGYAFHHEYTSLPLVPVNVAFMGAGLVFLREKATALGRGRAWALAGLLLLVVSMPVCSALRIGHWYRVNYPFLPARAQAAADKVSSPQDLFLCNERAPSSFLFYLHRKGWSCVLAESGGLYEEIIAQRMAEGASFFATAKAGDFARPDTAYARYFSAHHSLVYDDGELMIFRLKAPKGPRPASHGS